MKKLVLIVCVLSIHCFGQTKKDKSISKKTESTKMFPAPKEGFELKYIEMPPIKNEDLHKIELFVGKTIKVDCNTHFMMGKIDEKNLEGWGYTYYEVITNGGIASTMKGCINQPLKNEFVFMQSEKIRYNSRLPIVVYLPKGYQLKYRIWKGETMLKEAK